MKHVFEAKEKLQNGLKQPKRISIQRPDVRIISLLAVTVLIYLKALRGEFVWDDRIFFVFNDILPKLRPWNLKEIFLEPINYWGDLMPITNFFFVVQFNLFGMSTAGYHVFSILLYLAIGYVAFRFLSLLYDDLSSPHGGLKGVSLPPLICTAFFLFHPVHVEAVAYIVGQKDLLYSLFSLLSVFWLYKSSKADTTQSWKRLLPVIIFYYMAFLSKHLAVSTALFIPAFWFLVVRERGDSIPKAFLLWTVINIPVLFWMSHVTAVLEPYGITPATLPFWERILRGIRILGAHSVLVFKPFPLNFGYPFNQSWSPDANFSNGLAVLCTFISMLLWNRKSIVTIGLLIYVTFFLPVSQIFVEVVNATIYDRYLFMPLLGMVILVERAINFLSLKITGLRWLPVVSGIAISLTLCALTYSYIPKFRSDVASLEHAYRTFPGWNRAAFDFVYSLIEAGELDKAMEVIGKEETLSSPSWVRDYFNGWISLEKGDVESALSHLEKSSHMCRMGGYFPFPDVPLARALIGQGRKNRAEYLLKNVMHSDLYNPLEYYRAKKMLEGLGRHNVGRHNDGEPSG